MSDLLCYIHFSCAFKLFGYSVFPPTMTSADFSLFVVTTVSLVRPNGISSNAFIVYLQNLRFGLRLPFGSLLSLDNLYTCYAFLFCFCFSSHEFRYCFFYPKYHHLKLASSYGFVGNYIH